MSTYVQMFTMLVIVMSNLIDMGTNIKVCVKKLKSHKQKKTNNINNHSKLHEIPKTTNILLGMLLSLRSEL